MLNILCTLTVISCQHTTVEAPTIRQVTAYTLSVDETDATPCIGATGEDLCLAQANGESICAANWVPLNSIIYIEGYGPCRVADRMASKHKNRVDILMKTKQEAKKWGIKSKLVNIL